MSVSYTHLQTLFDVPYYIVESLKKVTDHLVNATDIYIGSNGARATNNANEIAHYECFSSLASDCMLKAMNALEVGKTEMEIGNKMCIRDRDDVLK